MSEKKHISDVRTALFKVLDGLRDKESPMDLERARAVNETAQVIINSAKVEVDFLKVVHGDGDAPFLANPDEDTPAPPQSALPTPETARTRDPLQSGPPPTHPWRSTVHKLRG
jgi:hypothetical protein